MYYENAQEARWRREEEEQARYENVELLSMGLTPGAVYELVDRTPEKWERQIDRMEAEETPWQREGEE